MVSYHFSLQKPSIPSCPWGLSHRIWATAWSGAVGLSGVCHPSWMPMERWRTSWWRMSCFLLGSAIGSSFFGSRDVAKKTGVYRVHWYLTVLGIFGWFERDFCLNACPIGRMGIMERMSYMGWSRDGNGCMWQTWDDLDVFCLSCLA